MLITQQGKILRMVTQDIRTIGRATQGVRLIEMEDDDRVGLGRPAGGTRGSVKEDWYGSVDKRVFPRRAAGLGCSSSSRSRRRHAVARQKKQIRQFFRASQLRDSETLANFAAVTFDPTKDGVVTSFEVTSVSEERRRRSG